MHRQRPHAGKAALRKQVLAQRASLGADERVARTAQVHRALFALPAFQAARGVHCYLSMAGEVDTAPIFKACHAAGKVTFAPFQDQGTGQLGVARWSPGDPVALGALKVPEPARHDPVALEEIDLVLVPGVAFDRKGNRLGHGKGYYDQFLAALRAHFAKNDVLSDATLDFVALAFEFQWLAAVPHEPWDIPMDAIVTEAGVLVPR